MEAKSMMNNPRNKSMIRIVITTAIILSLPLAAMRFTDQVNWSPFDFIVAGIFLLGSGLIYELAIKKTRGATGQMIATIVLLVALVLIWAELAVGIFGLPFAGS